MNWFNLKLEKIDRVLFLIIGILYIVILFSVFLDSLLSGPTHKYISVLLRYSPILKIVWYLSGAFYFWKLDARFISIGFVILSLLIVPTSTLYSTTLYFLFGNKLLWREIIEYVTLSILIGVGVRIVYVSFVNFDVIGGIRAKFITIGFVFCLFAFANLLYTPLFLWVEENSIGHKLIGSTSVLYNFLVIFSYFIFPDRESLSFRPSR